MVGLDLVGVLLGDEKFGWDDPVKHARVRGRLVGGDLYGDTAGRQSAGEQGPGSCQVATDTHGAPQGRGFFMSKHIGRPSLRSVLCHIVVMWAQRWCVMAYRPLRVSSRFAIAMVVASILILAACDGSNRQAAGGDDSTSGDEYAVTGIIRTGSLRPLRSRVPAGAER